jgi:hypothetical protein
MGGELASQALLATLGMQVVPDIVILLREFLFLLSIAHNSGKHSHQVLHHQLLVHGSATW